MGQDFVELSEMLQLLRGAIEAVQPLGVPADLEEVVHVEVDQVGTLVSSCRLQGGSRSTFNTSNCLTLAWGLTSQGRTYHDADVVSVVQRQGSVHLEQVVLRPEKTPQVLWVEAHHQRNVVEATEGCECILKYRLCPGVHFTDLKNLTGGKK